MQRQKILHVVSGILYDDDYAAMHGGNRFYYLNGDIETNGEGELVYIQSRKTDKDMESEDVEFLVKDMPKLVQRYIQKYTQAVASREEVQYICVHSNDLLKPGRKIAI